MTPFPKRFTAEHVMRCSPCCVMASGPKLCVIRWLLEIKDSKWAVATRFLRERHPNMDHWASNPATTLDEIADELNAAFDAAGVER